MTSRQRPGKQTGRLAAIISALTLALTVVSPTVPLAFAAEDDLLAEWSFIFTVKQTYADSPTNTEIESARYTSVLGGAMTWTGSYLFHRALETGTNCGTDVYHEEGEAAGSGVMTASSSGFGASAFGLDPAKHWTAFSPFTDGVIPTSYTHRNECFSGDGDGAKAPRVGPVFLPGTPDELRALPQGTVLQLSYTATDVYGPGPLTISYTATKGFEGDSDGDGILDSVDQCPSVPGPASASGCPDFDGDGIRDFIDQCPSEPGPASASGCPDFDGDGVGDRADNCPSVANADQSDLDNDLLGDLCDPDMDGDGLANGVEVSLGTNPRLPDSDGDGIADGVETNGGVIVDTDEDGTIDALDADSDDDGLSDSDEGTGDSDGDGIPDYRDPDVPLEVDLAASYAFRDVNGEQNLVRGGSRATFSGPGAHLVTEVCFDSKWTAETTSNRDTVGFLWNGGLALDLEKTTAAIDSVSVFTPPPAVQVQGRRPSQIRVVHSQTVILTYCTAPVDFGSGTRGAFYPLEIHVEPLSGVALKSLSHDLDVRFSTARASYGPYLLDDETSNGPVLNVNWSEQMEAQNILVGP